MGAALAMPGCSSDPGATGELDSGMAADAVIAQDAASDAAIVLDAGADAAVSPDATSNNFPSLSDYRVCDSNSDCPVGLGECVKSLELNREDSVLGTSVLVSDFFLGVSVGQGVCSSACSFDETSCASLSLKDQNGEDVPFTCQVVVGELAYPDTLPTFPFDSALDFDEMQLARPFAALCRPPFGLDDSHDAEFCQSCTDSTGCTSGACWRFDSGSLATDAESGTCLEQVPTNVGCPFGFESRSLVDGSTPLGDFCVPLTETCGGCQDRDRDGYGAGHCQDVEIDCDDGNSAAYFNPSDMAHAFPSFCGDFDYNCNGLSDESEQVGVAAFEVFHCEFCGDNLHNTTVNAGLASEAIVQCVAGTMVISSCADDTQVHCTGDPRTTGCEASGGTGGQLYYRDFDNDTYGDPAVTSLGCPAGAPVGFVSDDSDCNDNDSAIRPGVADTCDCWGDCASLGARIDNDCDGLLDEDVSAYLWFSDSDLDGAGEVAVDGVQYCGAPVSGSVPGGADDCSAADASSFGAHTQVTDSTGTPVSLPISSEPPRDGVGELYILTASAGTEVCDGRDNNCNGVADEGVQTTFYRDFDSDTFGDLAVSEDACAVPTGFVSNSNDCNDIDGAIHPDADELCDAVDHNFDGSDTAAAVFSPTCDTGLLGTCATGTQTCESSSLVCTQSVFPELLDDPDPSTPDDEDCDGDEVVIYVSDNGLSTNTGRLPGAPTRFLSDALVEAQNAPIASQLHVEEGSYDLGAGLNMANGVDIVGGFDSNFDWAATTTTLSRNSTPNSGRVVAIFASNTVASIAHLDLSTASSATESTDQFGVFATFARLHLLDVGVSVAQGSDGTEGIAGIAGTDGLDASGANPGGGACSSLTSGGIGSINGSGNVGQGVDGGLAGSGSNNAGDAGHAGQVSGGGGGNGLLQMTTQGLQSTADSAASAGDHGSGGGGATCSSLIGGNSGGGGGAGGCSGGPGSNGSRGGWAVGIVSILSADVTVDGVSFTIGSGGDGGRGGAAGAGGVGGVRGANTGSNCGVGGHGSGATGGGSGAGGHGGHSYAVFHNGADDICTDGSLDSSLVNVGSPGVRGLGGSTTGSGGDDGSGNSSAANGTAGELGRVGQDRTCFWSEDCTIDSDCPDSSQYCLSGKCYE